MGLTDKGYVRLTYDDILNSKIQRAKELYGEDIDTSDQTALGKFIRLNAYDQAQLEETLEQVYFARFPNTASGQSLDRLLVYGGISRNPAKAAVYIVEVTGEAGYLIETGFLVGTDTELMFATEQEYTIGDNGKAAIEVICSEIGSIGNVNPGAINRIINPDASISDAKGVSCLVYGADEESDADLRNRLKSAIAGAGSCNENAITASLLRIPTVIFATTIANNTDEVDSDGRPPHSFECYVLGGDDYEDEIASTIFEKRPVGIQTVGDKSVTIRDISGNERVVKYTPAPNVNITVKVRIKTTATYPEDGGSKIYASVADYINGLGIGNSLVVSTLYGYIYRVAGVQEVLSLTVATDGQTFSADNVSVPVYGVAVCENVIVEVVTQ